MELIKEIKRKEFYPIMTDVNGYGQYGLSRKAYDMDTMECKGLYEFYLNITPTTRTISCNVLPYSAEVNTEEELDNYITTALERKINLQHEMGKYLRIRKYEEKINGKYIIYEKEDLCITTDKDSNNIAIKCKNDYMHFYIESMKEFEVILDAIKKFNGIKWN